MENLVFNHRGPDFTAKQMYKAARKTNDLGDLAKIKFPDFFLWVKNIPYEMDKNVFSGGEVIGRPLRLFPADALDCKKKSILIGAYCNANKIPFRFVGSSERRDKSLHHVFPIVKIKDNWIIADATYKSNYLAQPKRVTKTKVFK